MSVAAATATVTYTVAVRNHRGSTDYTRGLSLADAKALVARKSGKLTTAEMFASVTV